MRQRLLAELACGFLVMTARLDPATAACGPARSSAHHDTRIGMAVNPETGKERPFIVADAGPRDADPGEVSIRLAESLGGSNVNAKERSGHAAWALRYLVFSAHHVANPPWPVSGTGLDRRAQALLSGAGGGARVERPQRHSPIVPGP